MNKTIFLIFAVFLTVLPSLGQNNPDYSAYPARVSHIKAVKVDLKSHPLAEKYRKQLFKLNKRSINFAGQYIVGGWNCGSVCYQFAIIDAETGKVFLPEILQNISFDPQKFPTQKLLGYQPDSKLLVVNSSKSEKPNGAVKTFLEWTGTELVRIESPRIASRVVLPEFKNSAVRLENETVVPLLLPAEIPEPKFLPKVIAAPEGSSELKFYSNIIILSPTEYDLSIDITPDCQGRPNCNYGHIAGKKNNSEIPVSTKIFQFDPQKVESISLATGVKGFYLPAPDDPKAVRGAQIIWLDGKGNQYAVSLKRASKEDIVAMAESMINNYLSIGF